MKHAPFHQIEAFIRVVEEKSFAKAGKSLQMTASSVSRLIKSLEQHLGLVLIQRTTRSMSLTPAGQQYFDDCAGAFAQLDQAYQRVRQVQSTPRGHLKLSLPVSFGRSHILPHLADFLAAYPEIELELLMNDSYLDLIAEGITVAIRIGTLSDSNLIARNMLQNHRILVASPRYLVAHGTPRDVEQLRQHQCLVLTLNRDGEQWRLHGPEGERSLRPLGRIRADNGDAIRQLAMDGMGIAFLSSVTVTAAIEAGDLVQVLPGWQGRESGVYAVCPTRPIPLVASALIDFYRARWMPTTARQNP